MSPSPGGYVPVMLELYPGQKVRQKNIKQIAVGTLEKTLLELLGTPIMDDDLRQISTGITCFRFLSQSAPPSLRRAQ